ncbi:hypothetical protein KPH14_013007 [Odynerus spinipes]|uniref:Endonuclease/exonuclease/phosphatase domain-containing protein n=1 Tax=Odynerus spinipes TaxID=1348599 RepID=A0AAD9R811_9HYME|nr:hypothetical protein KPH14_013007 [Odynerus spinipes]
MEELGMIVINGRSQTDSGGYYTYVDRKGMSVIDLIWIQTSKLHYFDDFEVIEIGTSDHLPTVLKLKEAWEENEDKEEEDVLEDKMKWDDEKVYQ